jgi:DNA-directed RNA polymerase specialized sigma24 family protein
MGHEQREFEDFYRASRDSCLRAVTAVVGDPERAEEQVAEAFARAWTSWATFLDLDTETTAKVIGIAPGTVMTHLSRAIAALRRDLPPANTNTNTTEVIR